VLQVIAVSIIIIEQPEVSIVAHMNGGVVADEIPGQQGVTLPVTPSAIATRSNKMCQPELVGVS